MNGEYVVYRTTCVPTGEFYIGCHYEVDHDDGYYGSGKAIKDRSKSYGKHNLDRHDFYRTSDMSEAGAIEKTLIEMHVADPLCLNIKTTPYCMTPEHRDTMRLIRIGKKDSQDVRNRKSAAKTGPGNYWYGRNHTEEYKKTMKESCAGIHQGEENPFYGKKHTDETLLKIRTTQQRNARECEYCGGTFVRAMYTRWHGPNCKKAPGTLPI